MKSPTSSYQEYQNNLVAQHPDLIAQLAEQTKDTFETYVQITFGFQRSIRPSNIIFVFRYKSQHQAFVSHTMQQIQQLEMQKQAVELNNQEQNDEGNHQHNNSHFQSNNFSDFQDNMYENFSNNQYGSDSGDNYAGNNNSGNENSFDSQTFEQMQKRNTEVEEPDLTHLPNVNFSQPPPGFGQEPPLAFQNGLPDLTKPPPGFPPFPEINNEDLMPSVPYFELPAGLMVPLVQVKFLKLITKLNK